MARGFCPPWLGGMSDLAGARQKSCRSSGCDPEFMEDALHREPQVMVVVIDGSWILSAMAGGDVRSGGRTTKKLSIIRLRSRVHGRRLASRAAGHGSGDRWLVDFVRHGWG